MNNLTRLKLYSFTSKFDPMNYIHRTPKNNNRLLEEIGGEFNDERMHEYNKHFKATHQRDSDPIGFARENKLFKTKDYIVNKKTGDKFLISNKINPVRTSIAAAVGAGALGLSGYQLYRYLKRKKLRRKDEELY
jgi:hypothetical protein